MELPSLNSLQEVVLPLLVEQVVSSTANQDVDLSELSELLERLGDRRLALDARKEVGHFQRRLAAPRGDIGRRTIGVARFHLAT